VLFGGFDGNGYLGDTWLWNGANGSWENVASATSAPAVTSPRLFTDPASGRVTMFGGFDGRFYQATTWQWTGTDWTPVAAGRSPAAREAFGMVYDVALGHIIVFGGQKSETTLFDDTWELSSR